LGAVGGVAITLIAWLSLRANILPGIEPLFSTFAVFALYLVDMREGARGFQQTSIAAMKTTPAYLSFLIVCCLSVTQVDSRMALVLGLAF